MGARRRARPRGARERPRGSVLELVKLEPRRRSVQCASPKGLHRIAYLEWGDPRNRDVLVCVHGLTRSAQDFDSLARELCGQFRVVCPDVAGRGDSDRRIAAAFTVPEKDLELWPIYDAVRCPTLVLRGELSDLLSPETAAQMTRRGPKARLIEIAEVGHAPTLMHPDQIAIVRDFLLEGEAR